MSIESAERLYLERQVTLARVIFGALSLVALLETSWPVVHRPAAAFLLAYLGIAAGVALVERVPVEQEVRIPWVADFLALAAFLYLTPSVSAFWFLFLFAVFALATRGKERAILALVSAVTVGVILRVALGAPFEWHSVWHWLAIGLGTVVSGLGMGYLAAREREHLARQQFLDKVTGLLRFDRGLNESIRQALGEMALEFDCEQACLAFRDDELERLFVWKIRPNETYVTGPETLPLARCETYLIDTLEVSLAWAYKNGDGAGEGFGWDRRTGQNFRDLPAPPLSTREEFGGRQLLATTIEASGRPSGRVILVQSSTGAGAGASANGSGHGNGNGASANGRAAGGRRPKSFTRGDLRWLEQIVRHLGPPLENVFLLRNLRARAVESERSRISRDLHDGILQTLLSLKIQLDVLKRKLPETPERAGTELGNLQNLVQQESEELRRMVTDLRPLRVESADLRELMMGFAERFRNEYELAVELFIEDRNLRLPDRICRELFQIYRESLHNVKKHANASHVVVKLSQDESKVSLVVDDNGLGFSFSGRFTSEELDRLRLGPISIKERTRSVGGALTLESNPGHGARLTIEIPLN